MEKAAQSKRFRKILHVDLDAFFCSVEENLDPQLKGKPFAVGGFPEGRGVVSSCSYPARKYGIKSAMPMKTALKKYPKLLIVQSHFDEYKKASQQVMGKLQGLTPLFEQVSIDEAFLDVTDLPEGGYEIARVLQREIEDDLCLPCSIGIASNKLVAKIATNIGKSQNKGLLPPRAIVEVPPGMEREFLANLEVNEMWGIGPKTSARLFQLGIRKIGDIQNRSVEWLISELGNSGKELQQHAQGIDDRLVANIDDVKSVSNEITFSRDIADEEELISAIRNLSRKVAERLRRHKIFGSTVKIKIRWPNFETHIRQLSLKSATDLDSVIFKSALKLFYEIWKKEQKVRLLGVGVSHICQPVQQLSLLDDLSLKENRLLSAVDDLHRKFGHEIIRRGTEYKTGKNFKH